MRVSKTPQHKTVKWLITINGKYITKSTLMYFYDTYDYWLFNAWTGKPEMVYDRVLFDIVYDKVIRSSAELHIELLKCERMVDFHEHDCL